MGFEMSYEQVSNAQIDSEMSKEKEVTIYELIPVHVVHKTIHVAGMV